MTLLLGKIKQIKEKEIVLFLMVLMAFGLMLHENVSGISFYLLLLITIYKMIKEKSVARFKNKINFFFGLHILFLLLSYIDNGTAPKIWWFRNFFDYYLVFLIIKFWNLKFNNVKKISYSFLCGQFMSVIYSFYNLKTRRINLGRIYGFDFISDNWPRLVVMYAGQVSILLIFGIVYFLITKKKVRILYLVVACLTMFSFLLNGSRSVQVGLIVSLIVSGIFYNFRKMFIVILISMLGIFIFTNINKEYLNNKYISRFETRVKTILDTKTNASNTHRIQMWKVAIDLGIQHPINGIGFDNYNEFKSKSKHYDDKIKKYVEPHNYYLRIFMSAGLPAFLTTLLYFGIMIYGLVVAIRKYSAKISREKRAYLLASLGSLLVICVQSVFTNTLKETYIMVPLTIILSGSYVLIEELNNDEKLNENKNV